MAIESNFNKENSETHIKHTKKPVNSQLTITDQDTYNLTEFMFHKYSVKCRFFFFSFLRSPNKCYIQIKFKSVWGLHPD